MNPMSYCFDMDNGGRSNGTARGRAVTYRSLHMNQFEEADRYAVDLYGAVQDAYCRRRDHEVKKLHEETVVIHT